MFVTASMTPPTEPISIDPQNFEMCRYLKEHGSLDGMACPACGVTERATENSRVPLPALIVVEDDLGIQATCRFCESRIAVDRG